MQISIQIDENHAGAASNLNEPLLPRSSPLCLRWKSLLCQLNIMNFITIVALLAFIVAMIWLCKMYLQAVLYWLEYQDSLIVASVIILLFTVVSLPISVGYIVLVTTDGYLFGLFYGLCVSVIGANVGLTVANVILRFLAHHHSVRKFADNETAKAITRVISGPLCFKIVCFARLTPIPFGLQNTIFALSKLNGKVYHLASFLGLLPAQCIAVYVGTTLRSMQDVLENHNISKSAYILISLQLMFGACLMLWIGSKARKELLKALAEGETKLNSSEKTKNVITKLIV